MQILNDVLDNLISRAKQTRSVEDIEELEKRNYAEVDDPSMLRFLVDMRGADIDNKQLRGRRVHCNFISFLIASKVY